MIEITYLEKTGKHKGWSAPTKLCELAVMQEKKLNTDVFSCRGQLTSNVGVVIKTIMDDKGEI